MFRYEQDYNFKNPSTQFILNYIDKSSAGMIPGYVLTPVSNSNVHMYMAQGVWQQVHSFSSKWDNAEQFQINLSPTESIKQIFTVKRMQVVLSQMRKNVRYPLYIGDANSSSSSLQVMGVAGTATTFYVRFAKYTPTVLNLLLTISANQAIAVTEYLT